MFAVSTIVVASALARMLGGGEPPEKPTPRVNLVASTTAVSPGKSPTNAKRDADASAIVAMLEGWYQRAFVDPQLWGDGTFEEIRALFAEDARASFDRDIASLTIGEARSVLARVEPRVARAKITLYYEGAEATLAVADVRFEARGLLKDPEQPQLGIRQQMTVHLRKSGDTWTVFSYEASSTQKSIVASPTPGASS